MIECNECGKKLGVLEGYRHPALGKKHLLCSVCFDQVSESVENWREFVLPYVGFFNNGSSNNGSSNNGSQLNWNDRFTGFVQVRKTLNNAWAEKNEV